MSKAKSAKSSQAAKAAPKATSKTEPQAEPQTDWLRVIAIVISVLGILVAGYLSYAELTGSTTQCADVGRIDCDAVQTSAYSKIYGVPVALLGFLGYVGILGVLVLEDQVALAATYGRTAVVGMALFGVIFSVYLSIIEGTVLNAWCQWCIASAVLITALLVLGAYRLYTFMKPLAA